MTTKHSPEVFKHFTIQDRYGKKSLTPDVAEDVARQHDHLVKNAPRTLSEDHIKAIKDYTDSSYRDINEALSYHDGLKHERPALKEMHNNLLDAFDHGHEADHDMHLYAGMSSYKMNWSGVTKTKAYTSTSLNPAVAHGFAHDAEELEPTDPDKDNEEDEQDHMHHIAHFVVPKGNRGWLYVQPHSAHSSEHEVLLKPGFTAKYRGTQTIRGGVQDGVHHVINVHTFHIDHDGTNPEPKQGDLF